MAHRLADFLTRHRFVGSLRARDLLTRPLVPRPSGPVIVSTNMGFDVLVDPVLDKFLESNIYYFGGYEIDTLHVMGKCLAENDVFVDVGSNIGQMALFAARLVGPGGAVFAFEPAAETFAILQSNIAMNGLRNVTAVNAALGRARGTALLQGVPGNRGAASLRPQVSGESAESAGAPVQVEQLDGFLAARGVAGVKMVKVDVEGFELEVLQGASALLGRPSPPILCVECLGGAARGEGVALHHFLRAVGGYRIYRLRRHWSGGRPLEEVADESQLPAGGNVFCFTEEHRRQLGWLP
jgi:FkbM family methyltransferase